MVSSHLIENKKYLVMQKILALFIFLATIQIGKGQAVEVPNDKELTLKDRFMLMKAKSQNFHDYKVIKENVLDGVWTIIQDSIRRKQMDIHAANASIAKLKEEVGNAQNAIKEKEESVAEIIHDSTHINAFGIDVNKKVFLSFILILFGGLVFLLVLVAGRLKLMYATLKEKGESLKLVNQEFDDFKHKALEKQIKLSRELQNERNKLQELRSS